MWKLLKRGFSSLRKGEGWRLARWWWVKNQTPIIVDDWKPPEWVDIRDSAVANRVGNRYITSLRTENASLDLEFPDPVTGVEFELFDVARAQRITVQTIFKSKDGGKVSRTATLSDGSFNDLQTLPLLFSTPSEAIEARIEVDVEYDIDGSREKVVDWVLDRLTSQIEIKTSPQPEFGVPRPRGVSPKDKPPIFLISVDSLRYDHMDYLSEVKEALGPDVVTPTEPRTQGHWTPASHASMLTGAHPGDHQYVGWSDEGPNRPINPEFTTLSELLTEHGYKCSGIVSHGRLLPEFGFGRGFHRYQFQNMTSWLSRESDGSTISHTVQQWLDRDTKAGSGGVFYFAHLFDPHYPYVPPLPMDSTDVDLRAVDAFRDEAGEEPVSLGGGDGSFGKDDLDLMKQYYRDSIEYTGKQLYRIIEDLKRRGMFEDAFVVITGDHGEEFFERGTAFHDTLHDANIRPGMLVKPPSGCEFSVPDTVDLIDLVPTVARLVGADEPELAQGVAWQDERETSSRPRVTERIQPDEYQIAVENGDAKGIFTYESDYPDRPADELVANGPSEEEFYRLSAVRSSGGDDSRVVDRDEKGNLRKIAREFLDSGTARRGSENSEDVKISSDVEAQLEKLGYK